MARRFCTKCYGSAPSKGGGRRALRTLLGAAALLLSQALPGPAEASSVLGTRDPVPLMAYYYIWFDETSWDRAKTDYSLLGRYSSDDRVVMEQHVRWAKEAGIGGFIVSWKSTEVLNRRLEQLLEVAAANDFFVSVIYQGLDFYRKPLPVARVARDLEGFAQRYAGHLALKMYSRPLVIWSGTWEFSTQEVEGVSRNLRDRLLLLASERNVEGYLRLAEFVDGNAYYWSSVNPDTFPDYQGKLGAMGRAVHEHDGLWVAPAAPGFDARLIGGTTVVERKEGETLRQQLNAAMRSAPDAIGLISWNEFSENSHIEPSETYGDQALELLSDRKLSVTQTFAVDSSDPGTTAPRNPYGLFAVGALGLFIVGSFALAIGRHLGGAPKGEV
ncbi:MAG: GH99 [uncultured Truepera sp.]|uniref:GH99 n=1 Tax=uncultured Truepera sp. TaxID=543023 RepID=A0A6J4V8J1_9DEIN|nr:MAG: GH99 [uncultured Truepera sp.]